MANRTKLTAKARENFLTMLKQTCNVTLAAESINVSRTRVYGLKSEDEAFSELWDNAIEEGVDRLEAEAHRRAFAGTDRPVFYKGKPVGAIKEYSDTLALALLSAHRPAKYRKGMELSGPGGGPVQIQKIEQTIVDPKD